MPSPYDKIVQKYKGASETTPTAPAVQAPVVSPVKTASPYDAVVQKYAAKKKIAAQDTTQIDSVISELENPSIKTQVFDAAKGFPAAMGQVAKEAVTNPVQTSQSVLLGLMDVGPAIVNTVNSVRQKVENSARSAIGMQPMKDIPMIPLPGETFNDFMARSETQRVIGDAAKMTGAFELGGAAVRGAGVTGTFSNPIAGNVVGGQIIEDPKASFKERAEQAAFDAAFGAAQAGGGLIARALKTKPVDVSVPRETPKVTETPAAPVKEPSQPQIGGKPIKKMELPKPPVSDVVYAPKKDLGVNPKGEKVLATTEYSTKTGKAIVYYAKELDNNPELRATVLDHEVGHVMDKRVNEGRNLSAELANPKGNEATLRNTLGPYARQTNQTIEEAATKLAQDIEKLSDGTGSNAGERFANAYAKYRQDPIAAAKTAPAFDSYMKHIPVEKAAAIQRRSIGAGDLKPRKAVQTLTARKAARDQKAIVKEPALTPKAKAKAEPKIPTNVVQTSKYSNFPAKKVFPENAPSTYKGIAPENIVHLNQGNNPRVTLIVSDLDKNILQAAKFGKRTIDQKYVLDRIAKEKGIPEKEAFKYMYDRAAELKAKARAGAEKNNEVLLNLFSDGEKTPNVNPKVPQQPKLGSQEQKAYAKGREILKANKKAGKMQVIDPDGLKAAFKDFDPKNHDIYSRATKRIYADMLKENKNPVVKFTAGGPGSGKSEVLIKGMEGTGFDGLVYDGTMREYASAINKFEQAIKAGKKIEVNAVLPDINRAWEFTLKRGDETGRYVPKDFFIQAHIDFIETMKRLVKEGWDVRLRDIRGVMDIKSARDKPYITNPEKVLAKLNEVTYNKSDLEKILYDKPNKTNSVSKAGEQPKGFPRRNGTNEPTRAKSEGSERVDVVYKQIESPKVVKSAPPNFKQNAKPGTGRIAATGLRTGKGVNTKSFNASKIDAPDDVAKLFDSMAGDNKNFSSQRLSKGNEDIKDLARLTGLTEDELLAAKPGSIANAETVTAARKLVLNKAQDLLNTLKGVDTATASPEKLKEIRDGFIKLTSMQKAVAGFRTEASNVFRSLGIELAPGENATLEELAGLLKKAEIASEGDVALFAQKVRKEMTLTTLGKVREGFLSTWYSAILSGPKTTARNVLSSGSNILTEIAAKSVNPKQWNEVMPALTGLIRGLKMGAGEAKEVLYGAQDAGKFMETGNNALRPQVFTGKLATYGAVVESVGRFLNAQDRLLASGAREMERASLQARGTEISKVVEDALSKAYGERAVYRGTPTGSVVQGLRDAAQSLRRRVPGSKFIIPFVDTVANVMDRQFDYFPITAAMRLGNEVIERQATRIIKDFGLKEADRVFIEQRIRDQQVGRLALGSIISTGAVLLAAQGRVSGNGPTNYSERQQLMRTGWRPNSIKIGDTWVPYTYLGPLGGILSMAGNLYDKIEYDNAPDKDIVSLVGNGLVGWMQTQLNQSFLSGVADLFDVATGGVSPKAYVDRFVSGLIPIPALYSQTKDMIFRQQYQTHSIVDKIRVKLGLTEGMFERLDQFGEPMTSDLIFGISPSAEKASKVDRFLIANDLVVSIPSSSTQYSIPGAGKEKRKLTDAEYNQYVKESGKKIYAELERRADELETLPADKQKKTVQDIVDRIRTQVRGQVMRGAQE